MGGSIHKYGRAVIFVSAIAAGLLIGIGSDWSLNYWIFIVLGGLALLLLGITKAFYLMPGVFFAVYSIQTTLFSESGTIRGLYYPIYILMVLNLVMTLLSHKSRSVKSKVDIAGLLLPVYVLFWATILTGLFKLDIEPDFYVAQRLFIYSFGILTIYQLNSAKSLYKVLTLEIWIGVIVAFWVIILAITGGFGYRGNVGVNANYISSIISFALIPMLAKLISAGRQTSFWQRMSGVIGITAGLYAITLLASRGGAIALALAFFMIIMRSPRSNRTIRAILSVLSIALVVLILPGGNSLIARFSEPSVGMLNLRTIMWQATLAEIRSSTLPELFFGHGFGYSEQVVSKALSGFTSTHNAYLQMALEFGISGLGSFLALHIILLAKIWKRNDQLAIYSVGVVTWLLILNITATTPDSFLYWLALGQVYAVARLDRGELKESKFYRVPVIPTVSTRSSLP